MLPKTGSPPGANRLENKAATGDYGHSEAADMTNATRFAIAAVGLAAGWVFGAPTAHASGDAPWCAVINLGMGDVYWDCHYRTVEECVPNVIAGNRGFCNLNPYGPAPAATAVPHKLHYKRHVRPG
jgi:hypothetical protein